MVVACGNGGCMQAVGPWKAAEGGVCVALRAAAAVGHAHVPAGSNKQVMEGKRKWTRPEYTHVLIEPPDLIIPFQALAAAPSRHVEALSAAARTQLGREVCDALGEQGNALGVAVGPRGVHAQGERRRRRIVTGRALRRGVA